MAAVNTAEFVKFSEPPQKLRLTFRLSVKFTILPSIELYTLLTDYKREIWVYLRNVSTQQ